MCTQNQKSPQSLRATRIRFKEQQNPHKQTKQREKLRIQIKNPSYHHPQPSTHHTPTITGEQIHMISTNKPPLQQLATGTTHYHETHPRSLATKSKSKPRHRHFYFNTGKTLNCEEIVVDDLRYTLRNMFQNIWACSEPHDYEPPIAPMP